VRRISKLPQASLTALSAYSPSGIHNRKLEETEAIAIKRVIAFQLEQEMKAKDLSKAALARCMNTSRAALDRLLDPDNPSITLLTLENAARALNKTLAVQMT
jgi:antitoxin HicB